MGDSNLEGDYVPGKMVKYLHARDHPGYSGTDFDSSYLKPTGGDDAYINSLSRISAMGIGIGFAFIAVYCLILWARRGCWKDKEFSRFSIGFTLDTDTYRLRSKGSRPVRFVLIVGFICSAMLMFQAVATASPLTSSVGTLSDVSGKLAKIFADLESDGKAMANDQAKMKKMVADAKCDSSTASSYTSKIDSYRSNVDAMNKAWLDTGKEMDLLADHIQTTGGHVVNIYVRFLMLFLLVPTGLGIAAAILSKSDIMMGSTCSGVVVMSLMALSMGTLVSLSVGTADYCITPTKFALEAVENLEKPKYMQDLAKYFVTCTGGNPLTGLVASSSTAVTAIKNVGGSCEVSGLAELCDSRSSTAATMTTNLDCKSIKHLYQSATYDALCTNGVGGLYKMWMMQIWTAVTFYLTMIFAAFVNLDKNPDDLDDDDNTPTARAKRRRRLKEKRRKSRQQKRSSSRTPKDGGADDPLVNSPLTRDTMKVKSDEIVV
jgi:hypothetical protein